MSPLRCDAPSLAIATATLPVADGIETVLLDIGGVLTHDYWERMLLTPFVGLASRLDLPVTEVAAVGHALFEDYCREVRDEADWWADLEAALTVEIPTGLRANLNDLVAANPRAATVLDDLAARDLWVGAISDTTAFWYPKQVGLIGLGHYLDPAITFRSHAYGLTTADQPGLFALAADVLDPHTTLVVNDHEASVQAAAAHGFHVLRYSRA